MSRVVPSRGMWICHLYGMSGGMAKALFLFLTLLIPDSWTSGFGDVQAPPHGVSPLRDRRMPAAGVRGKKLADGLGI